MQVKKKKAPALMLTSLLDMFTIILIFLIVSFEAEDYDFKLNPDLTLPESSAQSVFKPAVNMSITPDAIIVEDKKVYALQKGKATAEDYQAGQIDPVVEVLEAIFLEKNPPGGDQAADEEEDADPEAEAEDPATEEEEAGTIVLMQGDKNLDYQTLYLVMRSARIAGFSKYRLAIMKK
ncbi:MAG: biopolymer transporter ExbD [Deltaproteobacteria bacterium]|nr:biopolymer transporter ExbD [Deltaproteobacteria bacterium]